MATKSDPEELDVQEQTARIRRIINAAYRDLEDIERIRAETRQRHVQTDKEHAEVDRIKAEIKQRETQTQYEPLRVVIGAMTAGAALTAAIIAATKLFL